MAGIVITAILRVGDLEITAFPDVLQDLFTLCESHASQVLSLGIYNVQSAKRKMSAICQDFNPVSPVGGEDSNLLNLIPLEVNMAEPVMKCYPASLEADIRVSIHPVAQTDAQSSEEQGNGEYGEHWIDLMDLTQRKPNRDHN